VEFNQKEFEDKLRDLSFSKKTVWVYKNDEEVYYYPQDKSTTTHYALGYKNPVQTTFFTYINNIKIEITDIWFRDGEEYQKIDIIDVPKYGDKQIDYLLHSFETENLGDLAHFLYDQYENNKQKIKERRQKEKDMKLNALMEELG